MKPEQGYTVSVTSEALRVETPHGEVSALKLADVRRILVETNDSGPWGQDVWWVVQDKETEARFPLDAIGEDAFLCYAKTLPGFQVRGMNSISNAQFECWPNPK